MIKTWKDLDLRQWAQLRKADTLEDGDRTIAIIAALAGMSSDDVCNLPLTDYLRLKEQSAFVTSDLPDPSGRIAARYNLGAWKLEPAIDINSWTAIQFIDFQTLTERGDDDLVRLLSVILIPVGKTYGNGYDILEVQEAIQGLGLLDARDLLYFFALRSLTSALRGLTFSTASMRAAGVTNRKMRRALRRLLRTLIAAGAGSIASTLSPHPLGDPGTRSSR